MQICDIWDLRFDLTDLPITGGQEKCSCRRTGAALVPYRAGLVILSKETTGQCRPTTISTLILYINRLPTDGLTVCLCLCVCVLVRPTKVEISEGQLLCVVCNDIGNGVHFGAVTCEGCKVQWHG